MFSLKKQKGFTIVELLIVIVVIGILATLVIVTFSGIQQKGRNSQRQTDINAVASHVEAYYASTGTYPTAAMLNDSAWRAANTKGLDPEALKDPKATSGNISATTPAADVYSLQTGVGALTTACTVTGSGTAMTSNCDMYVLTATLEGGSTYTKQSN